MVKRIKVGSIIFVISVYKRVVVGLAARIDLSRGNGMGAVPDNTDEGEGCMVLCIYTISEPMFTTEHDSFSATNQWRAQML